MLLLWYAEVCVATIGATNLFCVATKKDSNIVGTIHELSVANKLYGGKLRAIRQISCREKKNIKFVGTIHELSVVKKYMAVNYGRFVGYRTVKKRISNL